AVVSDAALLDSLRPAIWTTRESSELSLLYEVLAPPIGDYEFDVPALLRDPRVNADAGSLRWSYGLYVIENTHWSRSDPYETDTPGSGLSRSLSRVGGAPTLVSDHAVPDEPFLLQVDLGEQLRNSLSDRRARSFIRASGLPQGGLLQVFHSTEADSSTAPETPGGGVRVIYFSEEQLKARRPPTADLNCAVFPVHEARLAVLPSFVSQISEEAPSFGQTAEAVVALQTAVDRFARGDQTSATVRGEEQVNPFRVTPQPPSRLLGETHYDFPLDEADLNQMTDILPLRDSGDKHVLLATVSSQFGLESVFGDGILDVWIRRSDLATNDFSSVYSRMRST
ncbi:MAG: DUF1963 domain-containing protein, partial [Actinomycetia bacterium]|nr:DUF1963 domain-containing protein [Actinomycetes bacterium]